MSQFLQWVSMGGYANFVWSAYGLVFTVLVWNALRCFWFKKRVHKSLQNWFKQKFI